MKIVFVINNLGSGGAERQITNLAVNLKKLGHEIAFITYRGDNYYKKLLDDNLIPIQLVETSGMVDAVLKTRRILRKNRQDAVISFLRSPVLCCCAAAFPHKRWKLIVSIRSSREITNKTIYGKLLAYFVRYADCIVCNSKREQTLWGNLAKKHDNKTYVVYNMIIPDKVESEYVVQKDNKINIVVAASYSDIKNIKGVLESLKLMSREERSRIHINWYGHKEIAIGDSTVYEQAMETIRENNLQDCITLNDETHEIADKMHQADAVGLFSHFEGLPNAICEGMMLGKPIIMTRVSDFDILVSEKNGFLCYANNPESIKQVLIKLSNTPTDVLLLMGKASKERAEQLFQSNSIVKQWLELLS